MEIGEALGWAMTTGLVSAGAVAFLFRKFMDIQVQKVIGKYEASLRDKTEALKTDLSIYAHEQTIGLTRLEELRADAIQAIYAIMIRWQELFLEITQPDLPARATDELRLQQMVNWSQNLVKIGDELSVKVRDTAIYFDEQSYQVIGRYGKLSTDLAIDFYDAAFGQWDKTKEPDYPQLFASFATERTKLRESSKGEFEKAQKTLVVEFRKLMKAERVAALKT
jgi:hypothetical protein